MDVGKKVGINWQPSSYTGWGNYCISLITQMQRIHRCQPVLICPPAQRYDIVVDPLQQSFVSPVMSQLVGGEYDVWKKRQKLDFDMLVAMGNDLTEGGYQFGSAAREFGVVFFENTTFSPDAHKRAAAMKQIVTGCAWAEKILRARGFSNVVNILQGIDERLFHPAPKSGLYRNRFLIFSGGKLEYRKGQDIVVEAFRRFHSRHPDSALVTAWHNFWPQSAMTITAGGIVKVAPKIDERGVIQVGDWLIDNGIPNGSFMDVGIVPNCFMPQILREMDMAVFPNRCEGGTNLVAMECLACGVPSILSANTGHLNIINSDNCYVLTRQHPITADGGFGTEGWGQSEVEELVELMERAYSDRAEAAAKGRRGAESIAGLTWGSQVEKLLKMMEI